jgi:hypothetical protein
MGLGKTENNCLRSLECEEARHALEGPDIEKKKSTVEFLVCTAFSLEQAS